MHFQAYYSTLKYTALGYRRQIYASNQLFQIHHRVPGDLFDPFLLILGESGVQAAIGQNNKLSHVTDNSNIQAYIQEPKSKTFRLNSARVSIQLFGIGVAPCMVRFRVQH